EKRRLRRLILLARDRGISDRALPSVLLQILQDERNCVPKLRESLPRLPRFLADLLYRGLEFGFSIAVFLPCRHESLTCMAKKRGLGSRCPRHRFFRLIASHQA